MKSFVSVLLLLVLLPALSAQQKNDTLSESPNNSVERLIFLDAVIEAKIFLAPKEAVRYAYEASTIIQNLPESELVAKTFKVIGDNYMILGIYDRALTMYSKGLKICQKLNLRNLCGEIHLSIAELYFDQQILPLSMENFNRAQDYFEMAKSEAGEAKALQGVGRVFMKLGEPEEALASARNSLARAEKVGDVRQIANSYNLMGLIHERMDQFDMAFGFFEKSKKMLDGTDHRDILGRTFWEVGELYLSKKDFQNALENYIKSLWIYKSLGDKYSESQTYLFLARLYLYEKDYRQVEELAGQALSLSIQNGFLMQQKEAYKLMSDAGLELQDYETALLNYKRFSQMKDSIFNANLANVITDIEVRNESDKKNRAIAELEKAQLQQQLEIGEKNAQRNTLLIVLAFALAFAAVLFYLYLTKTRANKLILESKKQAEEATKAKANFLYTMSHEIRTPMNAIIGMTHLLMKESLQEEQKDKVEIINFSSKNLLNLINDILDFSKIESGKVEFETVVFKPAELLRNLYRTFEDRAREEGLEFNFKIGRGVPETVKGDPSRLSQILINLIGNALKFTDKGGVSVMVEEKRREGIVSYLEFKVIDTGIGISKEKQQKIFESFSQADSHISRKYGGTGLGLAITKSLVELQDGSIRVISEPGLGSEFIVELGYELSMEPIEQESEKQVVDEALLKGKHVLIVEDDLINQKVAQNILSKWGIEVDLAENGRVALEKLVNNSYDIILMDLHMPEMDGFEATKDIRALNGSDNKSATPIIALTADAFTDVRDKIREHQMDDYVSKPFVPEELKARLCHNLT